MNKLNTRVTVFLDIQKCSSLNEHQKHLLITTLRGRIDKQGVLQVSSQQFRSQLSNYTAALKRMAELIEIALRPKRTRKKTRVPKRAVEKRLQDKKYRSRLKQIRSKNPRAD